jgi:hypothetical protein
MQMIRIALGGRIFCIAAAARSDTVPASPFCASPGKLIYRGTSSRIATRAHAPPVGILKVSTATLQLRAAVPARGNVAGGRVECKMRMSRACALRPAVELSSRHYFSAV